MRGNIIIQSKKPLRLLLVFLLLPCLAFAQTISVSGTITDGYGDALIGVSVVEPGTKNGAMTDVNGKYMISVSPNAKLTFSYVSYETVTLDVNGRQTINVVMKEDTKSLSEVVVIGYGTQRREAVTGSVSSIQGNALRDVQAGNITNALSGRLPGVVMTQTNSQPGQNMQIRVRGSRSLNATNDPLVVLDGIPYAGNIGDINPSDIKAIDILKDASATAIYGSRGANGVIMVTTYKGNTGQQARVTYDGYYGVETLFNRYPMMTGDEIAKVRLVSGKYTETDKTTGQLVAQMGDDEVLGQNTDWQKQLYKNGMVTNHHINVSGGTEKASYNFGTGYYKQTSLLPGQDYSRINLNGSLDQQIGKYIRFGFTTNSNYGVTNGQDLSLTNALALSPLLNPYDAEGNWKVRGTSVADQNNYHYSRDVIKAFNDDYADNQKAFGSYNSLYGEVKIPNVDGLSYRINVGLNYRNSNRGQFRGAGVLNSAASAASTASQDRRETTNWAVENLLTYDKYFDKHHLNITGLYSAEQTTYTRLYVKATNIVAPFFQYHNLGQAPAGETQVPFDNQDYRQSGLESWMGRVMYDYDSRYMLSVSIRADGSSRLAEGHKWHSYPAVSAGWNIARESFMEGIDWLDNLKLRVGYGQTANQAIDPYMTLGQLSTTKYNFGSDYTTGYSIYYAANPDLGWEYSKTWNAGLEFGFFKDRLSGSIDYYNVKTNDLLYRVELSKTSGITYQYQNVGNSKNSGIEVALNGTIIKTKDWTWDVGVNFAANKNEITSLGADRPDDKNNWWFVGEPINVIYDYRKIGIWQQNDPYLNILEPGGNVGMIKVKYTGEYNPDGTPVRQIGETDKIPMKVDPDWTGGFSTRVAWKNLDLSVIGAFQHGGILISNLHSASGYLNLLTGRRGEVQVDYWTPENTGGKYPLPGGATSGDNPKYGSTMGYFDATYLKVNAITLGYSFNDMKWIKDLGISSARLYFTVQNAFVLFSPFNKETSLDPVPNSLVTENTSVTSGIYNNKNLLSVGCNTPQTRNFLIGLNVSF